jgi:XTP/dITP diphosphohydrolase
MIDLDEYGVDGIMIEDTGLHIYDIDGFPGALIKFYHRDYGNERICKFHKGSKARAVTCIGYYGKEVGSDIYTGSIDGVIADVPSGEGFGWDPVFYLPEKCKTLGQMTAKEKNDISMRAKALMTLKLKLDSKN